MLFNSFGFIFLFLLFLVSNNLTLVQFIMNCIFLVLLIDFLILLALLVYSFLWFDLNRLLFLHSLEKRLSCSNFSHLTFWILSFCLFRLFSFHISYVAKHLFLFIFKIVYHSLYLSSSIRRFNLTSQVIILTQISYLINQMKFTINNTWIIIPSHKIIKLWIIIK